MANDDGVCVIVSGEMDGAWYTHEIRHIPEVWGLGKRPYTVKNTQANTRTAHCLY